ncbi:MAG TPA: right-handed parallel beta-helix repeat-containing protein [Usitatibacter sp.]|jgi:hypothetical protein|nr:right-handed parallel beta-helix repeat-containing protein [Usitatibacter sp.]
MKTRFLKHLALAALILAAPSLALAQATRTWVSGVGDDANPCSRTAPCKTFAGAISKTAPAGEINVLDPGGFGAVTITKSITISAEGVVAGVLVSGTNGIVVSAGPSDVVTLRGLDIDGLGTGINGVSFLAGKELHLERVQIYGFTQQGVNFAPSANAWLFVNDSIIRNNAGGGIWVVPAVTAKALIRNTTVNSNFRGVRADDGSNVVIQDSSASNNTQNGFVAFGNGARPVDMTIERSVASLNPSVGVYSGALCTVRISAVTATRNGTGLMEASGGAIISFGNNRIGGNTAADGAPTSTVGRM